MQQENKPLHTGSIWAKHSEVIDGKHLITPVGFQNAAIEIVSIVRAGSAMWVKATKENMRRSAILRDSVLPENHIHQWVINGWDENGVKFTNGIMKEWWELEILDESGIAV